MSQNSNVAYPDILGYITGVERLNAGPVQAAVAIDPDVIRAGRPFEVIVLIQNAADCPVDVTVVLTIPDRDLRKQKARFLAKVNRLVVGVEPAEVGYVSLPVNTLPDTASGGYKLEVEVSAKMLEKGQRIRPQGAGIPLNPRTLSPELGARLEKLRNLTFSSEKRALLKSTLEVPFNILAGKAGSLADLKPGWNSLWTMLDLNSDPLALLRRFYKELLDSVLPNLNRERLYKPVLERAKKRFEEAGYALTAIEVSFVARLMTLVLENASTKFRVYSTQLAEPTPDSMIKPIIDEGLFLTQDDPVRLPNWAMGLMRAIAKDKRAAQFPERAITMFAFDDLLHDALLRGFYLIEAATGIELGSDKDMEVYSRQILDKLNQKGAMDFSSAYLPLVMAGIVIYDSMLLPDEKVHSLLSDMVVMLQKRRSEMNEENEVIFKMARQLLDQALMKFGFQSEL